MNHEGNAAAQRKAVHGTLFIVSTPIGNLEDLSARARRILAEVDLVACEDTRRTKALLAHLGLRKPLVSYHKDSPRRREEEILRALHAGKHVALVSDAGTPLLQDPGSELVRRALAEGVRVVPVPGPSAALAAWVASGLAGGPFLFYGFLPRRKGERRRVLTALRDFPYPIIFYEAPHRLHATIADLLDVFGDRPASLARELTKLHEEFRRGSLEELARWAETASVRGEVTLVVAGAAEEVPRGEEPRPRVEERLAEALACVERRTKEGMGAKDAAKEAAERFSLSARELYRRFHEKGKGERESPVS
ncbi:MAG: 16S rRNA (cytidine(1402)-2'-O)-methyltransferase [Brockia lithotrophica]|nr:16S rRNA (cytidine(1402)-2'-O)-methyltransferase [Brockia lithotrophica]